VSRPDVEQLAILKKAHPNGWEVCPGCGRESMQYGQCILPGIGCGASKIESMPYMVAPDQVISAIRGDSVAPKVVAAPVDADTKTAKPKKAKRAPSRKGKGAPVGQGQL
jgi:hypothetical protein